MKRFHDLTGQQFGFLRVIACTGVRYGRRYWKVQCDLCGGETVVLASNLLSGGSKSCGCVRRFKAHRRMKNAMLYDKYCRLIEEKGMTEEQAASELVRLHSTKLNAQTL